MSLVKIAMKHVVHCLLLAWLYMPQFLCAGETISMGELSEDVDIHKVIELKAAEFERRNLVVKASCGCIRDIKFRQQVVKAREVPILELSVNTRGRRGKLMEALHVEYDGPNGRGEEVFGIEGIVHTMVDLPKVVSLGTFPMGNSNPVVREFQSSESVLSVVPSGSADKTEVIPKNGHPGHFLINFTPSNTEVGWHRRKVRIQSERGGYSNVEFAWGTASPYFKDLEINLGLLKVGVPVDCSIKLNPAAVGEVRAVRVPGSSIELKEWKREQFGTLQLKLVPTHVGQAEMHVEIDLVVNGRVEITRIPLFLVGK